MPLGAHKAAIMGVAGVSTADVVLLDTQTWDGTTAAAFTSDITSTYGEYIFGFYLTSNTDDANLQFQVDDDGGNNGYNDFNITSTFFYASHSEAASEHFDYYAAEDLAESDTYQRLNTALDGNSSDQYSAGVMHLFNPASTVYVKHFLSRQTGMQGGPAASDWFVGGYVNTTTAINAINFKASVGEMTGKIKMWGVK